MSASFDTVIESAVNSQSCRPGPSSDDACGTSSTLELTPNFSPALSTAEATGSKSERRSVQRLTGPPPAR